MVEIEMHIIIIIVCVQAKIIQKMTKVIFQLPGRQPLDQVRFVSEQKSLIL